MHEGLAERISRIQVLRQRQQTWLRYRVDLVENQDCAAASLPQPFDRLLRALVEAARTIEDKDDLVGATRPLPRRIDHRLVEPPARRKQPGVYRPAGSGWIR